MVPKEACGNFLDSALGIYIPLSFRSKAPIFQEDSELSPETTLASPLYSWAWRALLSGCEWRTSAASEPRPHKDTELSPQWVSSFAEFVILANDSQGGPRKRALA